MPLLLYPMYANKSHIAHEVCSNAPQNDVAVEPHMSLLVHVQKDCGMMVSRNGPACECFGRLQKQVCRGHSVGSCYRPGWETS